MNGICEVKTSWHLLSLLGTTQHNLKLIPMLGARMEQARCVTIISL
jgi:hypothetical protein